MTNALSTLAIIAVFGEIMAIGINILVRHLRRHGVRARAMLAALGWSAPVWLGLVAWLAPQGAGLEFHWGYGLCLVLWLGVRYGLTLSNGFVCAFQSWGEGSGVRFLFTILFAVLADVFVFGTHFNRAILLSVGLMLLAGVALHIGRTGMDLHGTKLVKLRYKLGYGAALALGDVAGFSLFKFAAGLQSGAALHTALFMLALMVLFLIAGERELRRDMVQKYVPLLYLPLFIALALAGGMASGVALVGLPVTLFIGFSLVRAILFALYEMQKGERAVDYGAVAASALMTAGLVSLAYL